MIRCSSCATNEELSGNGNKVSHVHVIGAGAIGATSRPGAPISGLFLVNARRPEG